MFFRYLRKTRAPNVNAGGTSRLEQYCAKGCPLKMGMAGKALETCCFKCRRKTCHRCTPEGSKNLILLSICYSMTFTLAWVIVSLFKYYAYFSCNYLFSASPYVIVIVNFRNFLGLLLFSANYKNFLLRSWKSVVVFRVAAFRSCKYDFPVFFAS